MQPRSLGELLAIHIEQEIAAFTLEIVSNEEDQWSLVYWEGADMPVLQV
jgi:hypothetical protein